MTVKQWCYFFGILFSVPLWLGLVPELSMFAVTSDNQIIFGLNILVVFIAVYLGDLS